jgi:chromosome segregation ATPase
LAQYVEIIDDETLDARSFYKKVNAWFARDWMDRPIIKGYYIRLSPDLIRSINNEDVFVTATREQSLWANTFDIATIKKLGKDITDFETQLESLDFQIQETEEQILKNQQEIQKLEEEGQIHVIEQSVRQTLWVVQIESSTLINIETITSEALRSLVASVNESLQKLLESADQIDLETQKRNQKKWELHEFLYRLQENYADLRQRKRELSAKLIPLVAQKNEIIRALGLW